MIIRVETAADGVFTREVENSVEAAEWLTELARSGMKCVSWAVER